MSKFVCTGNTNDATVEAVKWNGADFDGGKPDWIPDHSGSLDVSASNDAAVGLENALVIQTPQGILKVPVGSWLIKQENGLLTICASGVFKRFYKAA